MTQQELTNKAIAEIMRVYDIDEAHAQQVLMGFGQQRWDRIRRNAYELELEHVQAVPSDVIGKDQILEVLKNRTTSEPLVSKTTRPLIQRFDGDTTPGFVPLGDGVTSFILDKAADGSAKIINVDESRSIMPGILDIDYKHPDFSSAVRRHHLHNVGMVAEHWPKPLTMESDMGELPLMPVSDLYRGWLVGQLDDMDLFDGIYRNAHATFKGREDKRKQLIADIVAQYENSTASLTSELDPEPVAQVDTAKQVDSVLLMEEVSEKIRQWSGGLLDSRSLATAIVEAGQKLGWAERKPNVHNQGYANLPFNKELYTLLGYEISKVINHVVEWFNPDWGKIWVEIFQALEYGEMRAVIVKNAVNQHFIMWKQGSINTTEIVEWLMSLGKATIWNSGADISASPLHQALRNNLPENVSGEIWRLAKIARGHFGDLNDYMTTAFTVLEEERKANEATAEAQADADASKAAWDPTKPQSIEDALSNILHEVAQELFVKPEQREKFSDVWAGVRGKLLKGANSLFGMPDDVVCNCGDSNCKNKFTPAEGARVRLALYTGGAAAGKAEFDAIMKERKNKGK